jgi:hypothetical protein
LFKQKDNGNKILIYRLDPYQSFLTMKVRI